jgi:DNA polymerase-3 subunit gamma/tau
LAYLALYRKYRPQTFDEVVGQDHVTTTLAREVADGKVAHAYLFSGPRGTGKTTTARILAKALNCQHRGADGEPCNRCDSCAGIAQATSLDVIELDAASHNKVEDVREIRVNAGTVASMGGAKRIYILDEAHMLSRAASNALLKILEEPPEHVHFVMATTEPYKLPDTIRSRAQHFDFHPISRRALRSHLEKVAAREGHSMTDDAAALIVDHADGSARDALSLLEQVAALGEGKVEVAMVTRALGLADRQVFERLARAIEEGDAPAALELVAAMAAQGSDLRRFVAEALGFFRGIFLAQYAPNVEEIVDESSETVDAWRQIARTLDSGDVLRAIDQLSDALGQLRDGREERLVVELALLRLTRPETAVDPTSLATRLDRLEERLRKPPTVSGGGPAAAPAAEVEPVPSPPPAPPPPGSSVVDEEPEPAAAAPPAAEVPMAEGVTLEGVELVWPALVARVRDDTGPRRHALFREATPTAVADPATIVLGVPAHLPFHLQQLRADLELQRIAVGVASELLGGAVSFEFEAADNREQAPDIAEAEEEGKQRAPDSAEMAAAPEGADDPTGLILEELGGSVVAED